MTDYPTREYYTGKRSAHRRAVYKGIGLTDRDLDQPLIAVVSTASEVCPGHFHLQKVVQSVKNGIWQAGALSARPRPWDCLGSATICRPEN